MKRWILTPLLALACGAFALPAHAVMIGEASQETLSSAGNDVTVQLFNYTGSTLVNTHTSALMNGNVYKFGNTFYFANTTGVQKTPVGTSTVTTVYKGSTFELAGKTGSLLLISNTANKSSSFLYDTTKKTKTTLNRAIHDIKSASFTSDGKRMFLLAYNTAGKQKLFISTTDLRTLKEVDLPKNATSCDVAKLSPDGKQAFVACSFTTGTTSDNGLTMMTFSGSTLGASKTTMNHKMVLSGEWLSATKFATAESGTANAVFAVRTASAGKIQATTTFGKRTLTDAVASIPAIVQVGPNASSFYFEYLTVSSDADGNLAYTTSIGTYTLASKTQVMIMNIGQFDHLVEAH